MGRRTAALTIALLAAVPLLAGCREVAPPVTAPVVGQCHLYDTTAANASLEGALPVSCSSPHTAETIAVDEVLPAPDARGIWSADLIQTAAVDRCNPRIHARALGITLARLNTTRLTEAFFVPSPAEAKDGARWLRCDALAVDGGVPVVTTERQADQIGAMGAFAQCTDEPPTLPTDAERCAAGSSAFAAVTVAEAKPIDAAYPSGLTAKVRSACRSAVPPLAQPTMTRLSWTASVPSREEWTAGQTYGVCWLRVVDWKADPAAWPTERPYGSTS